MALGNALSLGSLVVELGLKTDDFNSALGQAERTTQNRLGNIGRATGQMAVGLGVAFAAGAAGLGTMVAAAAEFQASLKNVEAVSNATEQEMSSLKGLAQQLGRDTVFSADQAAGAMFELSKGGLSVADIMGGAAAATADLASAGGIDLAAAASVSANALNSFGLAGEDLARVVDKIAGVANKTNTDVQGFAMALAAGGAAAKATGTSVDDFTLAVGAMADSAIVGSDAGTSLKTFLINLIPASDTAVAAMQQLGIVTADGTNKFVDSEGSIKSMTEVAGILEASMEGLTKTEQTYLLKQAFGTDAFRAAVAMASKGKDGMIELAAAMDTVSAKDVAAKKLEGFTGAMELMKGSTKTLMAQLGDVLLPTLEKIVLAGVDMINWIGNLSEPVKKMGVWFAAGGTLLAGLGAAAAAIGAFSIHIAPLIAGGLSVAGVAMPAGGLLAAVGAVLTGPVGIVAGIAALGAAFAFADSGFRDRIVGIFGGMVEHITPLAKTIAEHVGAFIDFMAPIIQLGGGILAAGAKAAFVVAFEALALSFKNIADVASGVLDFMVGVGDFVTNVWSSISTSDFFTSAWEGLAGWLGGFGGEGGHWQTFTNGFASAMTAIDNSLSSIPFFGSLWSDTKDKIAGPEGSLLSWMQGLPDKASDAMQTADNWADGIPLLGKIWQNTKDAIGDDESGVLGAIKSFTGAVEDEFAEQFPTALETLKSGVESFGPEWLETVNLNLREPMKQPALQLADPNIEWSIPSGMEKIAAFVEGPQGQTIMQRLADSFAGDKPLSLKATGKEAGGAFKTALDGTLLGTGEGEGLEEIATRSGDAFVAAWRLKGGYAPMSLEFEDMRTSAMDVMATFDDPGGPAEVMGRAFTGIPDKIKPSMESGFQQMINGVGTVIKDEKTGLPAQLDSTTAKVAEVTLDISKMQVAAAEGKDADGNEIEPKFGNRLHTELKRFGDWMLDTSPGGLAGAFVQTWNIGIPKIMDDFIDRFTDPSSPGSFFKISKAWSGTDGQPGVMEMIKNDIKSRSSAAVEAFIKGMLDPMIDATRQAGSDIASLLDRDEGTNPVVGSLVDRLSTTTGFDTTTTPGAGADDFTGPLNQTTKESTIGKLAKGLAHMELAGWALQSVGFANAPRPSQIAGMAMIAFSERGAALWAKTGKTVQNGMVPEVIWEATFPSLYGKAGWNKTFILEWDLMRNQQNLRSLIPFARDGGSLRGIFLTGIAPSDSIPEHAIIKTPIVPNAFGMLLLKNNVLSDQDLGVQVGWSLVAKEEAVPFYKEDGSLIFIRERNLAGMLGQQLVSAGELTSRELGTFGGRLFDSGDFSAGNVQAIMEGVRAERPTRGDPNAVQVNNLGGSEQGAALGAEKSAISAGFVTALKAAAVFARDTNAASGFTSDFDFFTDEEGEDFWTNISNMLVSLSRRTAAAGISLSDIGIAGVEGGTAQSAIDALYSRDPDVRAGVQVQLNVNELFANEDSYRNLARLLAEYLQQEGILVV